MGEALPERRMNPSDGEWYTWDELVEANKESSEEEVTGIWEQSYNSLKQWRHNSRRVKAVKKAGKKVRVKAMSKVRAKVRAERGRAKKERVNPMQRDKRPNERLQTVGLNPLWGSEAAWKKIVAEAS